MTVRQIIRDKDIIMDFVIGPYLYEIERFLRLGMDRRFNFVKDVVFVGVAAILLLRFGHAELFDDDGFEQVLLGLQIKARMHKQITQGRYRL